MSYPSAFILNMEAISRRFRLPDGWKNIRFLDRRLTLPEHWWTVPSWRPTPVEVETEHETVTMVLEERVPTP